MENTLIEAINSGAWAAVIIFSLKYLAPSILQIIQLVFAFSIVRIVAIYSLKIVAHFFPSQIKTEAVIVPVAKRRKKAKGKGE
jgi:hypothetical protein